MERVGGIRFSHAILLAVAVASFLAVVSAGDDGAQLLGWIPGRSACQGTIGGCAGESEFDLASESTRRILDTSGYIGYGALQRGTVPCNRAGASYYNCRPGGEANPYTRGCSAITQCRS
ncbi:Rapid alkalinization factor [Platanthera zijinensis]|uniref:Rapid alkalinization factor n=1 Tax=Platanthera zijinensis TaxID=2320716 RepID=A0AAP0G9J6_9ASPA